MLLAELREGVAFLQWGIANQTRHEAGPLDPTGQLFNQPTLKAASTSTAQELRKLGWRRVLSGLAYQSISL